MTLIKIFLPLLLLVPASLHAQSWFTALKKSNFSAPRTSGTRVYKIEYKARGTMTVENGMYVLRSDAGRTFILRFGPYNRNKVAREGLVNKRVYVNGFVPNISDQREMLVARIDLSTNVPEQFPRAFVLAERPAKLIAKTPSVYRVGNVWLAAQFDKKGKFVKDAKGNRLFKIGDMEIHIDKLKQVYIGDQVSTGRVGIGGHGFAFFSFAPGGITDMNGKELQGLSFSLGGYSLKQGENGTYQQKKGVMGGYRIFYQLTTVTAYLDTHSDSYADLYPLTIPRYQQQMLLKRLVEMSTIDKSEEVYNLFTNSCMNTVLTTLNGVLDNSRKMKVAPLAKKVARTLSDVDNPLFQIELTDPDLAIKYLKRKGLVGDKYVRIGGPKDAASYRQKAQRAFYPSASVNP